MKILMVNKFLYPNGGSEAYIFKLGDYLKSQGHEVEYFGMEHEGRIVGNSANAYTSDMDFHSTSKFRKLTYALRTIYSIEARKKIKLVLDDFKPDVVHLNNINFQLTPSIIYEIKKYNIPIVQTLHDVQIACPVHRFYIEHKGQICEDCKGGKYYKCTKNKCLDSSTIKSFLATLESYYYHKRNTYNLVDMYICPSEFIKEKITGADVEEERTTILYNFSERVTIEESKNNKDNYCLYFGRLSKEKGLETLVDTIKDTPDINLFIAGSGPMLDYVKNISSNYKNIKYVGFKKDSELNSLVANARFTIYPSEWYENCPLSVVESQALGTPVIGSDLGGTKELIKDGETGYIFEYANKDSLNEKVSLLWNKDNLLNEMKDKCKSQNQNTIDIYYNKLLVIYENMIIKYKEKRC